jgi:hypothetical protein
LNSCCALVFSRNSEELRSWKALFLKVEKLNKKRNKLVHEPVSILYKKGVPSLVSLGPSHPNALALVKGQTTHQGASVVSAEYNPSKAQLLQDHRLTQAGVATLQRTFRSTAAELRAYRESVAPTVAAAIAAAKKVRK